LCVIEAPYDGPGLSVEVNSSCVTLSLQSPMEPNGVILSYSVFEYIAYHYLQTYDILPAYI